MGGIVRAVTKPLESLGRAVKRTVVGALGIKQKIPKTPEPKPAAPAAPAAESTVESDVQAEGITRKKKKGRGGLRIDLNTGGSGKSGVNVPVG